MRLLFWVLGLGDQRSGKSCSRETPVCSGPRQWAQSAAWEERTPKMQRHRKKPNEKEQDRVSMIFSCSRIPKNAGVQIAVAQKKPAFLRMRLSKRQPLLSAAG